MMSGIVGSRAEEKLASTKDRNRTFKIPDLVSDLLDEVVESAVNVGYPTNRASIVAALICHVRDFSGEQIETLVRRYLEEKVGNISETARSQGYVEPRRTSPGPRRRVNRALIDE